MSLLPEDAIMLALRELAGRRDLAGAQKLLSIATDMPPAPPAIRWVGVDKSAASPLAVVTKGGEKETTVIL